MKRILVLVVLGTGILTSLGYAMGQRKDNVDTVNVVTNADTNVQTDANAAVTTSMNGNTSTSSGGSISSTAASAASRNTSGSGN